jgi:hypothetical protein
MKGFSGTINLIRREMVYSSFNKVNVGDIVFDYFNTI